MPVVREAYVANNRVRPRTGYSSLAFGLDCASLGRGRLAEPDRERF